MDREAERIIESGGCDGCGAHAKPVPAAIDDCCAVAEKPGIALDDCCAGKESELSAMRGAMGRVLAIVMALNAVMFVVEFGFGIYGHSSALMADSLDMFGDAFVYGLSLYALDRSIRWRAFVALFKSGLIGLLGLVAVVQMGLNLVYGVTPLAPVMFGVGAVAFAVNLSCLALLYRYRMADVNMSSTFECSRNDVISNGGVLIAGAAVYFTNASWPDILAGGAIAAILFRSSARIWRQAYPQLRTAR
jgi:Co/Zn/Cd efflux system component